MRSVYTCLIMLLCVLPAQLLQAAGADTDTTGRAAVGFTGQKHARFKENSHKKDGGKYVHVWQGGISTQALEGSLEAINRDLSDNNIPAELHLVIGAVGARGKYTLLDATSADPQKELSKKELQSQEENIKKNTQAFSQWIGSAAQLDGDKALVIRLNVIVAQKWSDGVLVKRYSIEPSFSCPLRNDKPMIAEARVSLITKDLNHFARGANISDQESFDTEVGKLLKRIENDLVGELKPEKVFTLANSIPYPQDMSSIKERIETGKPKEDMTLGSIASSVYDLSDILTNTERTSLDLLVEHINEQLKGWMDLGTVNGEMAELLHKLDEIKVLITDFRMPSEQLQSLQDWMAEHAGKAVVWLHFDEDKLMYEFRAGTNRLLSKICALEKAGLFIANVKGNQLVYDLTSLYAATVNYFVPGKVTPLPPDYVANNPFFESIRNITVPGIPETWYNPDVKDYNGIYADYLYDNAWERLQRVPINALEEIVTGVKWPSDIDTRKYSIPRQRFALLSGLLNILPDALNGALNLPKGAISINELFCNPEEMEQLIKALESLSEQAEAAGGYRKWLGELLDAHMNPCMAAYYTGNICGMLLVSYLAVTKLGKISSIAAFITELGNLEPGGLMMEMLLRPVGKFVKFAVVRTGLWRLGKYVGKYVYENGRYAFRLARIEGKNLMEELKNVEWRSIKDIFTKPEDWVEAVGPNGEPLDIAYFIEGDGGGTAGGNGNGGGNGERPRVTDLYPAEENAPDAKKTPVEDQIGLVENPKTGEKEPVIVRRRKARKVSVKENDRIKLASKKDLLVEVPLYDEDGKIAGYLSRDYRTAEIKYSYTSKEGSTIVGGAMYFSPNAQEALPNNGEGYILVTIGFSKKTLREINALEAEIVDNIAKTFPDKKGDNLFLYWPTTKGGLLKEQLESVTKVLTEKYGYNGPEVRSFGDEEILVFSRPPASPVPVRRLEFATTGVPEADVFFLGPEKTNKPLLEIHKMPVPEHGDELALAYTDLRGEDLIVDVTGASLYNTYFYFDPEYDLSMLGINKQINAMRIGLDAMPVRLEQELPGTMRAVRDEALAYYKQNHAIVDGVIVELSTADGIKSFDAMAYNAVVKRGGSLEEAVWSTSTGRWAFDNGYRKAVAIRYEGPDPDQLAYVVFLKEEVAGGHGFGPNDVGHGENGNIITITPAKPGPSATGNTTGATGLADPSFTQGEIRAPRDQSGATRRLPDFEPDHTLPVLRDKLKGDVLIGLEEQDGMVRKIKYGFDDRMGDFFRGQEEEFKLVDFNLEHDHIKAVLGGKNELFYTEIYTSSDKADKVIELQNIMVEDAYEHFGAEEVIGGVRVSLKNLDEATPPSLAAYLKALENQDLTNTKVLEQAALQTPAGKFMKEKFGFDKVLIVEGEKEDFIQELGGKLLQATFVFYK